ncbi:hypothetical protein [Azospirillum sp. ST 5-10]|uniref:hypothetical protein n=1 Tax=unclassified Azospirillum TaxID=2630922 RepID=UPI003F4A4A9A
METNEHRPATLSAEDVIVIMGGHVTGKCAECGCDEYEDFAVHAPDCPYALALVTTLGERDR